MMGVGEGGDGPGPKVWAQTARGSVLLPEVGAPRRVRRR